MTVNGKKSLEKKGPEKINPVQKALVFDCGVIFFLELYSFYILVNCLSGDFFSGFQDTRTKNPIYKTEGNFFWISSPSIFACLFVEILSSNLALVDTHSRTSNYSKKSRKSNSVLFLFSFSFLTYDILQLFL